MGRVNLCHVGAALATGYAVAVQTNGERIRIETWILEAFMRDTLSDPDLRRFLTGAVRVEVA